MLSIELVPRALDQLLAQAEQVVAEFADITWLNIPDIKRLPVRSHEAAVAATRLPLRVIPHVRARDRSVEESIQLLLQLKEAGVKDALIITGDRFGNDPDAPYPTSLDLLREASGRLGEMKLWAAFDPYRGGAALGARLRPGQAGGGRGRLVYPAVL